MEITRFAEGLQGIYIKRRNSGGPGPEIGPTIFADWGPTENRSQWDNLVWLKDCCTLWRNGDSLMPSGFKVSNYISTWSLSWVPFRLTPSGTSIISFKPTINRSGHSTLNPRNSRTSRRACPCFFFFRRKELANSENKLPKLSRIHPKN